jgi:hypothetical protein
MMINYIIIFILFFLEEIKAKKVKRIILYKPKINLKLFKLLISLNKMKG